MKKISTPLFAITLLLSSCGGTTDDKKDENTKTDKTEVAKDTVAEIVEEELSEEGTEVEGDDRYDNLSSETTLSDCYIVGHFTDMDITYVTVDFVEQKEVMIEGDSEPGYELVNDNKKLRTFVVNEEYLKCGRDSKATFEQLIEKAKKNPETLFMIETEEGLVTELFERLCAG